MLPSAVIDQRAKLGVSAEESKAQRLKRQQARFRDRGGAFVPSTSNPLVDILLARTVSGESPSKPRPKCVGAKRSSISKPRQSSPASRASTAKTVIGSSKSKAPRKKAKAAELQADPYPKPAPKRRGRPAKNKKVQDPGSDTEQPPRANTNTTKPTSKGKGKQRAAPSTADGHSKPRAKRKPSSATKVIEVLDSDDEQTLVEATYKVKPNPKRKTLHEDNDDTDDDAPIIRKRPPHRVDDSGATGARTATHVKTGNSVNTGNSVKKAPQNKKKTQDEEHSEITAKKQSTLSDEEEGRAALPAKKAKVATLVPTKPKIATKPEPELYPTMDIINREKPNTTVGQDSRAEPVRDVIKPPERDMHDGQPLERVSKPKKRKKEDDNNDNRPRKAVRFSESGPPHSSSQRLKENQSDKRRERPIKSCVKDEPDAPYTKLVTKPPTRAKAPKGPPRKVLARIKASAAQYLYCVDSEPDELDCLP